jgi:hypothetical protein
MAIRKITCSVYPKKNTEMYLKIWFSLHGVKMLQFKNSVNLLAKNIYTPV